MIGMLSAFEFTTVAALQQQGATKGSTATCRAVEGNTEPLSPSAMKGAPRSVCSGSLWGSVFFSDVQL